MTPKVIDLTGKRFGRLTVLCRAENARNMLRYRCRCDCGKEKVVFAHNLRTGSTNSCGCQQYARPPKPKDDLTGKTFGELTIIKKTTCPVDSLHSTRTSWWLCKCSCGKEVVKSREYLRASRKASCGCVVAKAIRDDYKARERQRKQHQAAADLTALPTTYNTHICPECGKEFETYGCGWGYKLDGKLYCRWKCLRAAERREKDA